MLSQVTPEDLVGYGMIPELVGRLPLISALLPLDENDLTRILTEPRNALVRQYRRLFEMEGAELEFTPSALKLLSKKAIERSTGARALRAVTEELMLDVMYDLPDQKTAGKYIVNDAVVRGDRRLFATKTRRRKESA